MKKISYGISKMYLLLLILFTLIVFSSCKKFLDAKTNKQLVIPSSLDDAQALLDFYDLMNGFYPSLGNESDDNFYLLPSYFNSLIVKQRNHHTWAKEALDEFDWDYMYQIVLNANIAIETVDKQPVEISNSTRARSIKGEALFFRAFAFYQVAQYYARPYDRSIASTVPGIPLRLSSALEPESKRATLEETWQQIVKDFKSSIALVPLINTPLSRPSKAAAYAALARTYLDMGEFELSDKYVDSSLQLNHTLMDFNSLDTSLPYPFVRFNQEVLFPCITQLTGMHLQTNYRVDSLLYQSYDTNDLRRKLYFVTNGPGTVGFRGSYDGTRSLFNGLATDETYLIKAECETRLGFKDSAMADLNKLLSTRWVTGTFVPFSAATADQALNIILAERRKELILRGSRWFDLRRLNKDPRFAKTLIRIQNGITYTLPPMDPRYTFLLPVQVIALTGMLQNSR
ncbi:MAG: RagB/SusD family nutrient uptake outer membrane protein [Bacteroidota bacterium]|nr:RagB/SusD family nutrient uptake outer membrane protein [Bacteroidota bacterium]